MFGVVIISAERHVEGCVVLFGHHRRPCRSAVPAKQHRRAKKHLDAVNTDSEDVVYASADSGLRTALSVGVSFLNYSRHRSSHGPMSIEWNGDVASRICLNCLWMQECNKDVTGLPGSREEEVQAGMTIRHQAMVREWLEWGQGRDKRRVTLSARQLGRSVRRALPNKHAPATSHLGPPMPYALRPMPYALCPMPYGLHLATRLAHAHIDRPTFGATPRLSFSSLPIIPPSISDYLAPELALGL